MPDTDEPASNRLDNETGDGAGIDSRFRLVLVAAQRSKQLQRGARARIASDPKRRRSTSIALEEVRRGLVPFIANTKDAPLEVGNSRVVPHPAADAPVSFPGSKQKKT
ncbi:MAG TPA: DNA-directed RNA polymerase subunit omega [Pyrinomonadaceae bacterium]|nr:DNA-directed RNA polymerase subunit omega [Pyrinomonadaceae bacterium]